MRNNFDYYQKIEKPNMYLFNPDRSPIGFVSSENRHLVLRFNDLSELTFTANRIEGTEDVYDRLETKRLLFIENIGWFQITNVSCSIDGGKESKEITAESHQAQLKSRGFASEDRVYMFYNPNDPKDENYNSDDASAIPSVVGQLYQQLGIKISNQFADNDATVDYGDWTITYIDPGLWFRAKSYGNQYEPADGSNNICRSFEEEKTFGYDFMVNNVSNAFEVVFEFDFLYHAIKIKRLSDITISTDIYLSLSNVVESINVTEDAENIVTVLSCEGKDLDITTVNPMGTNYIVNFDYYKKLVSDDGKTPYPWMSQNLISALNNWETKWNSWQNHDNERTGHKESYAELVEELQLLYQQSEEIAGRLKAANVRLIDMRNARDSVINGASSTSNGEGLIIVETVNVGEKSIYPISAYKNTAFGSGSIDARNSQPDTISGTYSICDKGKIGAKVVIASEGSATSSQIKLNDAVSGGATGAKVGDYVYADTKFSFGVSNEHLNGTLSALIANLISDTKDSEGNWEPTNGSSLPYLYFFDEMIGSSLVANPKSFCKLLISAEVGVVKDNNGYVSQNGTAEVKGVEFGVVSNTSGENATFTITCPNNSTHSVTTQSPYFNYDNVRYKVSLGANGAITIYGFFVSGFQRYTTYKMLNGTDGWCNLWSGKVSAIKAEDDAKNIEINAIEAKMKYISDDCNVEKYIANIDGNGEALYKELLNYWIEGEYSNDNLSVTSETTMSETIGLAKELMAAGQKDLEKVSQPTFELSISAIDFSKLIEFRQFTDQLELGRIITIEKNDDVHYRPALVAIEYDLDSPDNFSLEFSTAGKLNETAMTFADLLNKATSTSRTVSANWSNLTDYWKHKEEITNLLDEPLSAMLHATRSNMVNQEFTIDETGILGRKKTDASGTAFSPQQVRIMNNTIVFTDDNWQTIRTALGSIYYTEDGQQKQAYGLVAEVLVGSLLFGKKLKIENENNTILLDDQGITIKSSSQTDQNTGEKLAVFRATSDGGVFVKYVLIEDGHIQSSDFSEIDSSAIYSTLGMKIDLENKYIKAPNFSVDSDGNLYARNATIEGSFSINDGAIHIAEDIEKDEGDGLQSFTYETHITKGFGTFSSTFNDGWHDFIDRLDISPGGIYMEGRRTSTSTSSQYWATGGYDAAIGIGADRTIMWDTIVGNITLNDDSPKATGTLWGYPGLSFFAFTNKPTETTWAPCAMMKMYTDADPRYAGQLITPTPMVGYIDIRAFAIRVSAIENGSGLLNGSWYLDSGIAITSDRNLKKNISTLPIKYDDLFDALKPSVFKYINGTSGRFHVGFIAQDVRAAIESSGLTTNDFAAYVESQDSGNTTSYIRYDEFIALNTDQIQKLKARVLALENEIKELKGE